MLELPTESNTHKDERSAILHSLALHIGMPVGKYMALLHLLGLFPLLAPSHFI